MNTKNLMFILLLLILILTTSGCGGGDSGNGSNPKPPEETADPEPLPIVAPNPPDDGSETTPPDNGYRNLCETGERQYHYDDGSESGVYPYYQCTYYAAKEFQKIAPDPGVNWGPPGGAGTWLNNAGNNGWLTTSIINDHRLIPGSIIEWAGHVQIVRSVFDKGIIVQGMNESWPTEPIDPNHTTHMQNGLPIYTGYVYTYCIPFDEFNKYGVYFGGFIGYILPIRQGDERATEASYLPSSYSVDGARVITGLHTEIESGLIVMEKEKTVFYASDTSDRRFCFSFYNNTPFGHDTVYFKREYLKTGEVYESFSRQDPSSNSTGDMAGCWFFDDSGSVRAGVHRLSFYVDGELRAYQDIVLHP